MYSYFQRCGRKNATCNVPLVPRSIIQQMQLKINFLDPIKKITGPLRNFLFEEIHRLQFYLSTSMEGTELASNITGIDLSIGRIRSNYRTVRLTF